MSSAPDDDATPLDGPGFLAANRANRERIRAEEAEKQAADPTPSPDSADGAAPTARRPLVIALAAAVAVLAVVASVLGYLVATSSADDLDRDGAVEAATSHAVQMFTYQTGKYDDLDRRIREISTSEFADEYIESSQLARKANDEAQGSSRGAVAAAGVVSISPTEAVVLVALDMTVTSPQAAALGQGPTPSQSRVELTLVRDGDRWLVSGLDVV